MADDHSYKIQADSVGKTACYKCSSVVDVSSQPAFSVVTCPQCGAKFTAPGKLGGFVLLKELGKGEAGATYKAYEKSLGRYVAIKVMHGDLDQDSSHIEGFMSEGRALASLDNPNIVRVFSLGQEKNQPYIAMELISGGGMEKLFSKEKPLDEVRTLEIITGVARALRAAGEIGLIHGDVKPENIMLSEKGQPKLVDFGIARFGGGKISEGDALGTPYYVAPEQVEHASVDHRADIYSLGATMYHALAGEVPFTGESLMKVLYARIEGPVPDIAQVRTELHPETVEVLTRMLQKNPDERYATYDDLLKDLLRACWATGAEIIQDAHETIPVAEKLAGPDWAKLRWPLVGLGTVMLVVGLWYTYFRTPAPPPTPDPGNTPAVKLIVDAPILSHRGGVVHGPTEVTIRCNTPAADIHYTLNDSPPTKDSPLYFGAITVAPGKTLRARAFRQGWEKSALVEAEYTRDTAELTSVVAIRGEANVAWERVKRFDRNQGFAVKLDQGAKLFSQASDLYGKAAYSACKAPYSDLVKLCAELTEMQTHRQKAVDAQAAAKSARGQTAEASSNRVRANLRTVDDNINRAKKAYDEGKFDQSIKHAADAVKLADAELSSILSKNVQAFEAAVKKFKPEERAKIEKFGGEPWALANAAIKNAKSAQTAEERIAACKACEKAIAGLHATAGAAFKAAKSAASNASIASKAAEIKTRLIAARKFLTDGFLRKARAEVTALEKLDNRNKEMSKLKAEIEKKLRFSMPMSTDENRRFPKIDLAWIPAGEFKMGSPTTEKDRSVNEVQHPVKITKPFYIGIFEINRQQYQLFQQDRTKDEVDKQTKRFARVKGRQPSKDELNKIREYVKKAKEKLRKLSTVRGWDEKRWTRIPNGWWDKPGYNSNHGSPVTCISWTDAAEFCVWLSKESGRSVRLPTEAEWEYACRAGGKTAYSFGDEVEKLHKYGNYADKSSQLPSSDKEHDDKQGTPGQVGRYGENPWKLKDMHGSVAEWCSDRWGVYRLGVAADPRGPTSGLKRVVRGGSWYSAPKACRSAARYSLASGTRDTATGFRVVVEIEN